MKVPLLWSHHLCNCMVAGNPQTCHGICQMASVKCQMVIKHNIYKGPLQPKSRTSFQVLPGPQTSLCTSCSQRLLGRGYVQVQASFRWYTLVQDVFCWQSLLIQGLNLILDAIFPRDAFHSSCHPKQLKANWNVTDSGYGWFAFPTQGPAGKGRWRESS